MSDHPEPETYLLVRPIGRRQIATLAVCTAVAGAVLVVTTVAAAFDVTIGRRVLGPMCAVAGVLFLWWRMARDRRDAQVRHAAVIEGQKELNRLLAGGAGRLGVLERDLQHALLQLARLGHPVAKSGAAGPGAAARQARRRRPTRQRQPSTQGLDPASVAAVRRINARLSSENGHGS